MLATMQTGDTFQIKLILKNGNTVSRLIDGQCLVVGLYNNKKQLVARYSTENGGIEYSDGVYTLTVSHDDSMKMSKAVYMEVTITDGDVVLHGDRVTVVGFEKRENNKILNEDGTD